MRLRGEGDGVEGVGSVEGGLGVGEEKGVGRRDNLHLDAPWNHTERGRELCTRLNSYRVR